MCATADAPSPAGLLGLADAAASLHPSLLRVTSATTLRSVLEHIRQQQSTGSTLLNNWFTPSDLPLTTAGSHSRESSLLFGTLAETFRVPTIDPSKFCLQTFRTIEVSATSNFGVPALPDSSVDGAASCLVMCKSAEGKPVSVRQEWLAACRAALSHPASIAFQDVPFQPSFRGEVIPAVAMIRNAALLCSVEDLPTVLNAVLPAFASTPLCGGIPVALYPAASQTRAARGA